MKYLIVFVWAVLFLYFFNLFMPKDILYFVIGIPVLFLGSIAILRIRHWKER